MKNSRFNLKVFTSFMLTISFLIISVSGVILYLTPRGKIANWIGWQLGGLSKTEWIALHTVFILVFLIAGLFHLFYFNWKVFWFYLKQAFQRGKRYRLEFYAAGIFSIIFLIATVQEIPPVITIVRIGDNLTASWEKPGSKPPMPHAEEFTLKEAAQRLFKVKVEKMMMILKQEGITPVSSQETLKALAMRYNLTPSELYQTIKKSLPETNIERRKEKSITIKSG